MKRWPPDTLVGGLVIVVACMYLWQSPPMTAPDEGAHLSYPRTILIEHTLPSFQHASDAWENHQPPLYYLLSLPIVAAAQNLSYPQQIIIDRLTSLLLLIGVIGIALAMMQTLVASTPILRTLGMSIFLLPIVPYLGASYNNDILALFMAAALTLAVVRRAAKVSSRQSIMFGVLVGLSLLTKVTLYPYVALAALCYLWRQPLRRWLLAVGSAIIVSGWWFVFNLIRVGDILGVRYTKVFWWADQHRNLLLPRNLMEFVAKTSASFIGAFGKQEVWLPVGMYVVGIGGILTALFCAVRQSREKYTTRFAVLSIAVIMAGVVGSNTIFFQPQGRYAIAAMPFIAILTIAAVQAISSRRLQQWVVGGIMVMLIGTNVVGLVRLHNYFTGHQPRLLVHPRSVDLVQVLARENPNSTTLQDGMLVVTTPSKLTTSADSGETSRQSRLELSLANPEPVTVDVYWRVAGQIWFTESRKQTLNIKGSTTFIFPEQHAELVTDIRLWFRQPSTQIRIRRAEIVTD